MLLYVSVLRCSGSGVLRLLYVHVLKCSEPGVMTSPVCSRAEMQWVREVITSPVCIRAEM